MDAADGAQRDRRDLGIPESAFVCIARSRHEVLLGVSGDARGWWYKTDSTPGAESKPECVRREMGAIGETGMFIETNFVRRSLAATHPDRFHGTLSPGKKPPRQGQSVTVPRPRT